MELWLLANRVMPRLTDSEKTLRRDKVRGMAKALFMSGSADWLKNFLADFFNTDNRVLVRSGPPLRLGVLHVQERVGLALSWAWADAPAAAWQRRRI